MVVSFDVDCMFIFDFSVCFAVYRVFAGIVIVFMRLCTYNSSRWISGNSYMNLIVALVC